ncbi:EGF-like repeat and discoidin I-like domain-containing protein 3 [Branchiostoma lanceolatum]|uniref:EGF-like repeat and discoidin I-like domain-containing protein 3 n=1 Tax=Branchiostoma lanceolatum TaxID=7740 RepID=UPI00345192C0
MNCSVQVFAGNTHETTPVTQTLPSPVTTRYIRFEVWTWHRHIVMRVEVLGCYACPRLTAPTDGNMTTNSYQDVAEFTCNAGYRLQGAPSTTCQADSQWTSREPTCTFCQDPLGVESRDIPDSAITASSEYEGTDIRRSYHGRLNTPDGRTAWCSGSRVAGEWLQVDLGGATIVYGVITQGRPTFDQWVTSYKLQFSWDESSWTTYKDSDGSDKVLAGNTDATTAVTQLVDPQVTTRYVRFVVQTWQGHICMRVEVLGCMNADCLEPLGMEAGYISDSSITASSAPHGGLKPYRGRLNTAIGGSWTGANAIDEWLQVDLGGAVKVHGVITQGRATYNQLVTSYKLRFSWDESSWTTYKDSDGSDKELSVYIHNVLVTLN